MRVSATSLCLVVALCVSRGLSSPSLQTDDYETFPAVPGSRYKLPSIHLSWVDALAHCQSDGDGSHLVVINSDAEADVVQTLMARLDGTSSVAFVGISDIDTEGEWVTVQGVPVVSSGYARWAPGNPSDSRDWNCGLVSQDALYRDGECRAVWPFICEMPGQV